MTNDNKRGGTIAENESGKLERVSARTCVGEATLPNGKVITKRFRGSVTDEQKIIESWERWQCRKTKDEYYLEYEEEQMDRTGIIGNCPFGAGACAAGCPLFSEDDMECSLKVGCMALGKVAAGIKSIDARESVEMVAVAVGELASAMASSSPAAAQEEPEEEVSGDGVEAFLDGKTFISFVNLHSKAVASQYRKFCKERGYEPTREKDLLDEVAGRFPELKRVGVRGGSVFEAA